MKKRLAKMFSAPEAPPPTDPIQDELDELERRFPGRVPAPTRPLTILRPWDISLLEHWLYTQAIAEGRDATYRDHPWPPREPYPVWESYWEEVAPYLKPGMTIVEVGPGNGFFTDRYIADCERAYLVDYSELLSFLLLPAKYKDHPQVVPIHSVDCRMPTIPDESADLFFSISAFVHIEIEAHYGYFLEAFRVLKPGGVAMIHFASMVGDEAFQHYVETCPPNFSGHPLRCHHPETVQDLARRVGFEITKIDIEKTVFSSHIHLRKPA